MTKSQMGGAGLGNARVLEGQNRALELALSGAPLAKVLEVLVDTVEAQSEQEITGSILLMDSDGKHLKHGAAPHLPAEYCAAIDGIPIGPSVGSCGTAAYTRETVVVTDVQTDPRWTEFKALAGQHGLRACWSSPILSSRGEVLGTFALYHRTPSTPAERDLEVVRLLSNTAAVVLERDLNARQRTEAQNALKVAAQDQLARLQQLFEHAPAAIAVVRGEDYVFEIANPVYLALIGGRSVLGKPVREAVPEAVSQGFLDLLRETHLSQQPYVGRSVRAEINRGADGTAEEGFYDFVYQPIPGTDAILMVAFETTQIVLAKLEAEAAQKRAEASEHSLKTFIDNLPELAWTARADGYIDYYNQRWYEYTGTTFEQMGGWGWEKVHDPKLLPLVLQRWQHSLRTGERFEMEFTLRGADGIARWFLTRVQPVRDEDGRIVRWFGTNTDIDAIKASYALSEAMAEQSAQAEEALLQMRSARDAAERRVAELEAAALAER